SPPALAILKSDFFPLVPRRRKGEERRAAGGIRRRACSLASRGRGRRGEEMAGFDEHQPRLEPSGDEDGGPGGDDGNLSDHLMDEFQKFKEAAVEKYNLAMQELDQAREAIFCREEGKTVGSISQKKNKK
ncbi:unnamed protein product, partial [Urochloa humidicola]